jgi:hypothetical protein
MLQWRARSGATPRLMPIFISYRRGGTSDITGRIDDRLRAHFGQDDVFRDVDNIPPGADFVQYLSQEVGKCDVFIAIVGPDFFGDRIKKEGDFVRIELEAALSKRVPIIPVLVGGASLPKPRKLPRSLGAILRRHAVFVGSGREFDENVRYLVRGIERLRNLAGAETTQPGGLLPAPEQLPRVAPTVPRAPVLVRAASITGLVMGLGALAWVLPAHRPPTLPGAIPVDAAAPPTAAPMAQSRPIIQPMTPPLTASTDQPSTTKAPNETTKDERKKVAKSGKAAGGAGAKSKKGYFQRLFGDAPSPQPAASADRDRGTVAPHEPSATAGEVEKRVKHDETDALSGRALRPESNQPRRPTDDAPSTQPAPVATTLPQLEKSDIVKAMMAVQPKVTDCYNQYKVPGTAMLMLTLARSGRVTDVSTGGKFAGTPTGSCLESAVRSAKLPPTETKSFHYPFTLR